MRRLAPVLVFAIAAGLGIGLYVWRRNTTAGTPTAAAGSAGIENDSAAPSSATTTTPSSKRVRRLSPDDRKRLASDIATARDRRRAAAGGTSASTAGGTPQPSLADETLRLEDVGPTVKAALEEAIPMLADCYPDTPANDGGRRTAAVVMTMTSEPDVGTVIDTTALKDEHDQPLARELDDCLRTTIESLGLPPLEKGGKLPLQYSFVFD